MKSINKTCLLKRIYAEWQTHRRKDEYSKLHKQERGISMARFLMEQNIKPYYHQSPEYSNNEQSLKEIEQRALDNAKQIFMYKAIMFGDSLLDFPRDEFTVVPSGLNFARAGDTGRGFADVIEKVGRALPREIVHRVKYSIIGTFGNGGLQYQDIGWIKREIDNVIYILKTHFPYTIPIFIGFPPVYDVYCNLIAPEVERYSIEQLYRNFGLWGFLSLDEYAGKWGIFPTIELQKDGIHLTDSGAIKLNMQIYKVMRGLFYGKPILDETHRMIEFYTKLVSR